MNKEVFSAILRNYKLKYDIINDFEGRDEIYKWPAVKCCIDNWDIDAPDFLDMFKRSMRLSQNIIENRYKHPINGIIYLCEHGKTELIREEFRKLLEDKEAISDVQNSAEAFQDSINDMIGELAPEKWSFEQDRRDPLMYLAFIKPETSYMFKAEPARVFANYVEFGDDIGSGQTFKLEKYYRLCDEVLAELESDEELISMLDSELKRAAKKKNMSEESLLDIPGKLRIVVYDIMYCANSLWLYEGIMPPVKKGSKEDKERTRQKRIEELSELIENKTIELNDLLENELQYPNLINEELLNVKYGKGKVINQEGHYVFVDFNGLEKSFALPDCITKGFLKGASEDVIETCNRISEANIQKKSLSDALRQLSSELSMLE